MFELYIHAGMLCIHTLYAFHADQISCGVDFLYVANKIIVKIYVNHGMRFCRGVLFWDLQKQLLIQHDTCTRFRMYNTIPAGKKMRERERERENHKYEIELTYILCVDIKYDGGYY